MLTRMVQQMHWANTLVLDWLGAQQDPSDELLRLASHILNAETIWIRRAQESDYDRNTFKVHEMAKLREINQENLREFGILCGSDVKKVVAYHMIDGTPGRSSIEDMIIHVFSHGFHHRGQMASLASKSGKTFPNVAYIQFTRS